jgi:hypothetical protein
MTIGPWGLCWLPYEPEFQHSEYAGHQVAKMTPEAKILAL